MKAVLIAIVGTVLVMAPAMRAQDIVKDTEKGVDKTADVTKDTSKDVAHGTKKAATKTADVTKDTSKDVAHGTTTAAKKTGSAVDTGPETGHAVKTGADKTANAVKQQARTSAEVGETAMLGVAPHTHTFENRREWVGHQGPRPSHTGRRVKLTASELGYNIGDRVKRSTSFSALSVFFWPVPFFHVGVR